MGAKYGGNLLRLPKRRPASCYLNRVRNGGGARREQSRKTSYTARGRFCNFRATTQELCPGAYYCPVYNTTYTSSLRRTNVQFVPPVRSVANPRSTVRLAQMAASLAIASTLITRVRHAGMASTQIRTLGTASPARRGYAGFRKSWGVIRAARNFF